MRITIYSAMADNPEYRIGQMYNADGTDAEGMVGPEWSGEIGIGSCTCSDGQSCIEDDKDALLERIFRLFNRVSDEDAERLQRMDYKLPSLSVGDIVTMEGTHYLVCGMGFKPVPEEIVRKIKANPSDAWMIAHRMGR
jgi:hypothetical protein